MSDSTPRRTPAPGRARKRAIRDHAARAGVAYSEAARQLESVGLRPGETLSSYGRTIYPIGSDPHRQLLVERRERRSFEERVSDTRRAAVLPHGRAQHLVERFPPSRGRTGSGVGTLYHGEGREELLAMLYIVTVAESPGLLPEVGDLTWIAELGEDTALDTACADIDREARRLLDQEPLVLWSGIQKALDLAVHSADGQVRQEAIRQTALLSTMMTPRLGYAGEPYVPGLPVVGVRQTLDALLIVADDGHAPGTRVRLTPPHDGRWATIIGARWGSSGPPVGYLVWLDGATASLSARPDDLIVLADQETIPR
ncbi:hypothetical protein [Micromonospora inaquosa]|uniref:Uncharacterized protein n=1 Tax=Micromonospora inaquosa TaxID=2203716 RepID=A0A3N9WKN4_9ACTN|nr:hypothetical protein [Micromonospora inaquosa]RQX01219.1 hypothetical protein DLJ59_18985 [Micromonospora inaquosa]